MKSILNRRITFLGLVAVIAALATFNFSGTALAYTADDPAVVYSCFDTNEDGSFVTETDNETGDVNLVPCEINHGDNAWMLTSSALVLMMTPAGLAIFYGGLSRQKNAVNTLHMVFITTGIIAVQWALWGYSLAFGPDAGGYGFIGDFRWAGLQNVLARCTLNCIRWYRWYNNSTSDIHDIPDDVRYHYTRTNRRQQWQKG